MKTSTRDIGLHRVLRRRRQNVRERYLRVETLEDRRLLAGELDTTFDGDGYAILDYGVASGGFDRGYAVAVQPDSKLVVSGEAEKDVNDGRYLFAMSRFTAAGNPDTSFDVDGKLVFNFGDYDDGNRGDNLLIQADGNIVTAGRAEVTGSGYDYGIARLTAAGDFDTNFDTDGLATFQPGINKSAEVDASALQSDGSIVAAGAANLTIMSPATQNGIAAARFNPDGSLSESFDQVDFPGVTERVKEVVVRDDGKIYVVGGGDVNNAGSNDVIVIRYNTDGTLDTTFNADGIFTIDVAPGQSDFATAVVLQGNQAVIGVSTASNDDFTLLRINDNGTVDNTFGTSGNGFVTTAFPVAAVVENLALTDDGRIVAGGNESGVAAAVYHANGQLDTSFGTGGTVTHTIAEGNIVARDMALAPDGKIVFSGDVFNGEQGTSDVFVMRLTAVEPATAGSIHGRKFNDIDGDGVRDPNEPGLNGWTIELVDEGTGQVVNTQVTHDHEGEPGHYWFENVAPGDYQVREVHQSGYLQTYPASGHYDISVADSQSIENLDFGNTLPGSIHGFKFEDTDNNGDYDPQVDLPLAGVEFTLTGMNAQGNQVDRTASTNAAGEFWFEDLLPSVANVHDDQVVRTLAYHQLSQEPATVEGISPVISGNGQRVVYRYDTYGSNQQAHIIVMDVDGTNRQEVDSPLGNTFAIDISDDGSTIMSARRTHDTNNCCVVRVVGADGVGEIGHFWTYSTGSWRFRLSPDGSKVFFTADRDFNFLGTQVEAGLYVIDADAMDTPKNARAIVRRTDVENLLSKNVTQFHSSGNALDISSDGSRIVFGAKMQDGEYLFGVNEDGSELHSIINADFLSQGGISGDGSTIHYLIQHGIGTAAVDEAGVSNFFGGDHRVLATGPPADGTFSASQHISHDGSLLLVGDSQHIYRTDGSGSLDLVTAIDNFSPVLSSAYSFTMNSAGDQVTYIRGPSNARQVYTIDIDPVDLGEAPQITNAELDPNYILVNNGSFAQLRGEVQTGSNTLSRVTNAFLRDGEYDNGISHVALIDDGGHCDGASGDNVFGHCFVSHSGNETGLRNVRIQAEVVAADGRGHATALEFGSLLVTTSDPGPITGGYTINEVVPSGHSPTTPSTFTTDLLSGQELVWRDGAAMLPPDDPRQEVNVGDALMFGDYIDHTQVGSLRGTHVFYNNSYFDNNMISANSDDDIAIARDKRVLRSGEAATSASYTSFDRGINGIMVDIARPAGSGQITAADFRFRVGNSDDVSSWSDAPAPIEVATRGNAGLGDSERVTIIWPDGAIRNKWLEVTVLATAQTQLSEDDIFYIGNAVGDSGDSPFPGADAFAFAGARDNATDSAEVDNAYDYNRDQLVDGADLAIARDHATNFDAALRLITPPAPLPPPAMLIVAEDVIVEPLSPIVRELSGQRFYNADQPTDSGPPYAVHSPIARDRNGSPRRRPPTTSTPSTADLFERISNELLQLLAEAAG